MIDVENAKLNLTAKSLPAEKAPATSAPRVSAIEWLQYAAVWTILNGLTRLPRQAAIFFGEQLAALLFFCIPRLHRVGLRNLELAFPEKPVAERQTILKQSIRSLGRQLGEFSQLPKLTVETVGSLVVYDGLEHFHSAQAHGKGVLVLTGHFGSWELSAFSHALYGHPMNILVRRIDNPLIEALVNRYRTCSGNHTIDKNGSARAILTALRNRETVGVLADLNMVRNQGVFCNFFGLPACSTPMLATLALRTGAPVIPGFLIWEADQKRYRLRFDPAVELIETGDSKHDIEENTARFMKIIEQKVQAHPEQWLWIHRRWKTRPEGDPGLY